MALTSHESRKSPVVVATALALAAVAASPAQAWTPTPPPVMVDYRYSLAGAATLKTLTTGSVPLSGSIDATLDLRSNEFTADLALNPAAAKLTTLGFLPVTAKLAFVSTAPTTGTLAGGVLSSNSKVRIKLPEVSLLGVRLAGGPNCQTKTASSIALKSTDGGFAPLDGGNLAGTFAISDLTGCGFLTGLVSPLTAGKGNAIALKLTPKAVPPTPTPTPRPLKTLTYQCNYPLIGPQPLSVVIDAAIPSTVQLGYPTREFAVKAVATASGNTYGISLAGAKTIEGVAEALSTVDLPDGRNLPVTVPMTVDQSVVPATVGDMVFTASGATPSLRFDTTPGRARVTVDSLTLNLIARDAAGAPIALPPVTVDSDGNPDTFDVACTLSPPGQDTILTTFELTYWG